jgi:2-polyprenyl-3-methyl-5-hydroxy-6-metoxy-1,4-benzoquinol methylase
MTEYLNNCPVCNEAGFAPFLEVTDHFLTRERFNIVSCNHCGFKFINPRPVESEIERYYQSQDYISHDSTKNDLLSKIYKTARHFSLRGKLKLIKKYSTRGSVLDIGCGTGDFLACCQAEGFSVTGMEPGDKARAFAVMNNRVKAEKNLIDVAASGKRFDIITLWHVLEHIHRINETIEQIRTLLSENGTLIVAVPNCDSPDAKKYREFWAAYDVPRHLYHFNKKTISLLFGNHGFNVKEIFPQKLDAYYVSLLSEKYRSGSNNYPNAFFAGLFSNLKAKNPDFGFSSQIFILTRENP